MPKKRQIQYVAEQTLAGGTVKFHWKPSPRLRRLGWTNLDLGTDRASAYAAAIERNKEVERCLAAARGEGAGHGSQSAFARAPVRPRWCDLERRFLASDAFQSVDGRPPRLKPSTQREYRSRLGPLSLWALDGELRLADLDRQMVLDLRRELVRGSLYRAAALLRVLGIILQFGEDEGLLAANPCRHIKIPTPPKRKRRLLREHLPLLLEAAAELGHDHIALAVTLGFYTMQRRADLLGATGFQIRPIEDVSSDARKALAAPDGRVSGLWLQQGKTDTWVAVALAPWARPSVEAAIAARREAKVSCTHLITVPGEDKPIHERRFSTHFREVVDLAVRKATERQEHDLARVLSGDPNKPRDAIQFRDFRRSGMCWLREMWVPVPLIASISGHSIRETEEILETYMPRDTRAAAEGMAIAVARQAERDAAEQAEQGGQG